MIVICMDDEKIVRAQLISFLKGGNAHLDFDEAIADFPIHEINNTVKDGKFTPWQLLEHMRIAQWDILDYIRNPDYKEMEWPKDYWPEKSRNATEKDWHKTIADFKKDSEELQGIVKDPKTNLFSNVANGDDATIVREILLVVDHNAYHIGQFAMMRRAMGTWGKDHS